MELRQLRVLQAVGEAGSFSAAADRLDYTQPAVSKIVATLERQLGTTLVDRGIRPIRLTEAGSALAERAAAAFEQIAAGELEVEAIANLSAGSLRVGTFSSAGAAIVVDALRAFRKSHPDVDFSITEIGMPSALTRSLRRGDLDLGVSFDYPEIGDTFGDDLATVHLLPRIMLQATHPGVAIRPLATDPPMRRISAVRLSTRYLTPATERFTALLVAASTDAPTYPNGT